MENTVEEILLEPDPARVMEGLRDTGYDFNTAMADLVDNSIAANATKVNVIVQMDNEGEVVVYIADNGCGMNLEELKNAMRYGSQVRKDLSSLGKFGLGLKTASTAFCRSLSLLSKGSDNTYRKVQWDLDEIARVNKWKLLQPKLDYDEIDILESVTDGNSGTLVIWEKVDRLMKNYSTKSYRDKRFQKIINDLKFHFSMVYQRFVDHNFTNAPNIEIIVNNEKILPWDPFCTEEINSSSIAYQNVEVELPDGSTSSFVVDAWLLPRVEEFSSPTAKSTARISNDMEGFYVYRENRLIYQGDWLGIFVSDPHISLLRVNFSFDHSLDDAFNVDIKKSRIMLNEEIYQYLKEQFLPAPRRAAQERYRKGQNKNIEKNSKDAHKASNNNIEQKAATVENAKIDVIDESTGKVQVSNSQGTFTGTIRIRPATDPSQTRVIPVQSLDSNMLWEPTIVNKHHAVSINQSHPYYQKIYAPVLDNSVMITGMDALLWALSEAELSTYNDETREQYEDMRVQVSRILKKLVNELPDPEINED